MLHFSIHTSIARITIAKLCVRWYDAPELVVVEGVPCTRADAVVTYERTLSRMTGFKRTPSVETASPWPTIPGTGPHPELR